MKKSVLILLLAIFTLPMAAQDYQAPPVKLSKDMVRVDGKSYYAHVAAEKQTLYSISKAYGVTLTDIYAANRTLDLENNGLKTGQVLLIPAAPQAAGRDETPSQASADSTIDKRALFPGLKGIFSKIFKPDGGSEGGSGDSGRDKEVTFASADSTFTEEEIPGTIEVAVLLPFTSKGKPDSKSEDFYAGILLAAKDLGGKGININLHTYDIGAGGISRSMLSSADVVIGPLSQDEVSRAVSASPWGKYVISPLEPKTAGMADSMRVVHAPTPANEQSYDAVRWALSDMAPGDSLVVIRESGKTPNGGAAAVLAALNSSGRHYSVITYGLLEGTRVQPRFAARASRNGTTRYLIASENESFVNDAVRNINLMAFKRNDVVLYGPSRLRTFNTIETENLHKVNTHISASYHIDYSNPEVKKFVMAYRALFGSEPNSFAFHGYDTMSYFATMCSRYGRNWFRKLPDAGWRGLQTDFGFDEPGWHKGQVNKAVRRVIYTPDFQITIQ